MINIWDQIYEQRFWDWINRFNGMCLWSSTMRSLRQNNDSTHLGMFMGLYIYNGCVRNEKGSKINILSEMDLKIEPYLGARK